MSRHEQPVNRYGSKRPIDTEIRTLLLDDDAFARARIQRLGRKSGLPLGIDEVCSIAEMEQALEAQKYDMVLIDYHLPAGDGISALDAVMACPYNRDAGKIMISGTADETLSMQAVRAGFHDFMRKDWLDADMFSVSVERSLVLSQKVRQDVGFRVDKQQQVAWGVQEALQDAEVRAALSDVLRAELEMHRNIVAEQNRPVMPYELTGLRSEIEQQEKYNALFLKLMM